MNGYDIQNAMMRAYGLEANPDPYDVETFNVSEALARLQRFLMVLMMSMKGSL